MGEEIVRYPPEVHIVHVGRERQHGCHIEVAFPVLLRFDGGGSVQDQTTFDHELDIDTLSRSVRGDLLHRNVISR